MARQENFTGYTQANIVTVLQGYLDDVDRIVFNGDGYSAAWEEEAARRGLPNNRNTPTALKAVISERAYEVFSDMEVLGQKELHARYEVALENYIHTISIEADLFQEMCSTIVLPVAYKTVNSLGETHRHLKEMSLPELAESVVSRVKTITDVTVGLTNELSCLKTEKQHADQLDSLAERAASYADRVKPCFDRVRAAVDTLEGQVDDRDWHLPKYRELLFLR